MNNSARSSIAQGVDLAAYRALADSICNDGMQALLLVLTKRDLPGGLGDSRALRAAFHTIVTNNIATHAGMIIADAMMKGSTP
jgi:hypothetical protein